MRRLSRRLFPPPALALLAFGCASAPGDPEPPAAAVDRVTISPAAGQLLIGATLRLEAVALDASGAPLPGRAIAWSSTDDRIAMVGADGIVEGVGTGRARIRATVEGVTGEGTVNVAPPGGIQLDSIAPATLIHGDVATLHGRGFSPDRAQNQVLIDGVAISSVITASSGAIEIRLPTGCLPARVITVQVTSGTLASGALSRELRPRAFLTLEPGDLAVLDDELCIRLEETGASARYLIGLQSVSEDPALYTPARLAVVTGASTTSTAVPPGLRAALPARHQPRATAGPLGAAAEPVARVLQHARLLAEWQSTRPALRPALGPAAVPEPGDTLELRVPGAGCPEFTPVEAVVRLVGERAVWVEDVDNPAGGFTSDDYEELSGQFDAIGYPTTVSYFGPPTDIDTNQRVLVLLTREVNRAQTFGFARGLDLQPRSGCPASNEAEIVYVFAPDPDGEYWQPLPRDWAAGYLPSLVAHEFTHWLQGARRMGSGAVSTTVWELEGQATFAQEVVSHALTGRTPGQNYGAGTLSDDYFTELIFRGLSTYFGYASPDERIAAAPDQCGWLGGDPGGCVGFEDAAGVRFGPSLPYAVGWTFWRWLADQYGPAFAGGEQGLLRALNEATPQLRGFANVEQTVGVPMRQLLARWAASLYVDDRPDAAQQAGLGFTSWNLHDIFESHPPTARLAPRARGFAPSDDLVLVRSGSSAYWLLAGAAQPGLAVSVRADDGSPPAAHLQLWVVRMQ